jgi:hypothetical protein
VKGGEPTVSSSGVTKADFISKLKIEDYKNILCDKYKTGLSYK